MGENHQWKKKSIIMFDTDRDPQVLSETILFQKQTSTKPLFYKSLFMEELNLILILIH
jgi:hypothetical protein